MIITTIWEGKGTEASPFQPKQTSEMKGKGYSVLPDQAKPKAGQPVKVEVK